ncbi:MAG: ParA family protein, partial [Cyanobacteria bacterium P01_F01_bin.143]
KTTIIHNLGYHLAQKHRVLLVDMDPQASLTAFMGIESHKLTDEQTIYGAITERSPLKVWSDKIHNMHIVPANILLAGAEIETARDIITDNRQRLKLALSEIIDQFDYILIDCPPSLGILSVMSVIAATHIIVPIQCQYKCYLATNQLLETIARIKKGGHKKLEIACFIPTMYDKRTIQDSGILEAVKSQAQGHIYVTPPIPKSTVFPDAAQANQPLALFKKNHPAVTIFSEITRHLTKL